MARVYVSHSGLDSALAHEVHRWLVEAGHEVFLPDDLSDGIAAGEEWEQRLYERLRWADAVVCLLTSAYLSSIWCTAEVAIARSQGSQLLPLRVEPGVTHPLLGSLQQVNVTGDGVETRTKLAEVLRRVDAAGGAGWPDNRSPFPGLRPFTTDQHRVFFGRTREIEQLATLLRSPAERVGAVILVVGPSGCGKSSLVQAGLLPVMAAEPGWLTLRPIWPGTDPIAALTRELAATARQAGVDCSVAEIRRRLDDSGLNALVDDLLLDGFGPRRSHLLVAVDQFEELLTQTGREERARFAELLRRALDGRVHVVATVRPEFLDQLLVSRELAGLPKRVQALEPLRREALGAVIEGPARQAGISVDEGLVARLVTDTESGDALPLLAYVLDELADGVGRGGRLLNVRYEQLGRLEGTLARLADTALAEAVSGWRSRERVLNGLLRFVAVDEHGRVEPQPVRLEELPDLVVDAVRPFIARRLMATDIDDNGSALVRVTHKGLLSAWKPLASAIEADSRGLRLRSELPRLAAAWNRESRDGSYLLRGKRLAEADQWAIDRIDELGRLEQEFLDASRDLALKERGLLRRVLGAPQTGLEPALRDRYDQLHLRLDRLKAELLEHEVTRRQLNDQLKVQDSENRRQQAKLREAQLRLIELEAFDRQAKTEGGVFISYAHRDSDVVDALTARLDREHINYWRDQKDLYIGDVVDKAISKAIQDSVLFLIVLTSTSIGSAWVERELDEAAHEEVEGGKMVLPVIAKNLPDSEIPRRLRRKLYVDISDPDFEEGCSKLVQSINHHLRTRRQAKRKP